MGLWIPQTGLKVEFHSPNLQTDTSSIENGPTWLSNLLVLTMYLDTVSKAQIALVCAEHVNSFLAVRG